jgi:predicted nucleic-acid-binding Zn-ribbon protein
LTPEAIRLVETALEELKKRNVKNDYCPRCETFDWNVDPVAIPVTPLQGVPAATPQAYFPGFIPAIQIVCKNCGYIMFHNLNALGLAPPPRT